MLCTPESAQLDDYLAESEVLDFSHPSIQALAQQLNLADLSELELVQACFEYVRDTIPHAWDIQSPIVTCNASQVLREGTGICYAKAHLLASLLRSQNIPCGFCYQKLLLFDTPEQGYVIHAFNGVYLRSLDRWVFVDARGNKPGVQAEFCLDTPKLAFIPNEELGELIYPTIFVEPNPKTLAALRNATNSIEMYQYELPDSL